MYVLADTPKDILQILDNVIKEKDLSPLNGDLAGNLKHEFAIPKGKAAVSPMLMQLIIKHQEKYPNYFKKAHSMLNYKACEIELFNLWVNFQKKHEFNPMHTHDGIYSFVIWHKVPYSMEDEKAQFHETKKPSSAPAPVTAEGVKSTKKSRKQKPAKKPRKKSGHRVHQGEKRSKVSGRRMIKLTRRKGRTVSTA